MVVTVAPLETKRVLTAMVGTLNLVVRLSDDTKNISAREGKLDIFVDGGINSDTLVSSGAQPGGGPRGLGAVNWG